MIIYNNIVYGISGDVVFNNDTDEDKILINKNNRYYELKDGSLDIFKLLISKNAFKLADELKRNFLILYKVGLIERWIMKEIKISPNTNLFKYKEKFYISNLQYGNINELSEYNYNKLRSKNLNLSENDINNLLMNNYLYYQSKQEFGEGGISNKRVYIIFSYNCNMKCVYCFENHINKERISNDSFNNVLTVLKDIDTQSQQTIVLYGGEPLLSENYKYIESLFNQQFNNTKFEIITNGVNIAKYLSLFLKFRKVINQFIITLDGTPEIHNKRRKYGLNSFNIIIKNIKDLIENGFFIKLRINLDEDNIDCQPDLIQYLNNLFHDHNKDIIIEYHRVEKKEDLLYEPISFKRIYELSNIISNSRILISYSDEIINRFVNSNFYCRKEKSYNNYCDYYNNIIINYNGDIYHCNESMGNEDMIIGNVNDSNYYSNLDEKNFRIKYECNICQFFILCRGNCPMENKIKMGSIDKPVCKKQEFQDLINFIIEKKKIAFLG